MPRVFYLPDKPDTAAKVLAAIKTKQSLLVIDRFSAIWTNVF
jgi:hypothetical protein